MNNIIWDITPINSETSIISNISTTPESSIRVTSDRIMDLLPLDDRQNILNSQNQFELLLSQFEGEVKKISDDIGFDYSGWRLYSKNLLHCEESIQYTLKRIFLTYGKLANIYDRILTYCNSQLINSIRDRLFIDYLEDLVYECINNNRLVLIEEDFANFLDGDGGEDYYEEGEYITKRDKPKILELDSWALSFYKDNNNWLIERLELVNNLTINVKLSDLTSFGKKLIFWNLPNLKQIDFGSNDFSILDDESLQIIFWNLDELRLVKINGDHFSKLNQSQIKIIFNNFKNVRYIHLWQIKFDNYSSPEFKEIIWYLKNAKLIEVSWILHYSDNKLEFIEWLQSNLKVFY